MRKGQRLDTALAGLLLSGSQLEAWLGPYDRRPLLSLLALALVVPLCWRRSAAFRTAIAVAAAFLLGQLLTGSLSEMATGTLPVLISTYSAAAFLPLRQAGMAGGATLAAAELSVLSDPSPSSVAYAGLVVGVAWAVGRVVAVRTGQIAELARLSQQLRQEQELRAQAAVTTERARIARELHDVVAHGVSVMVVQAGAAEGLVTSDPSTATRALQDIQAAGRQALVELRRMLDLLRSDEPDDDGLQPQPGLDDIPALVANVRGAGLCVTLEIDDLPRTVPAAVGMSAYRIVQEAMTNTLKHADSTRVDVHLRAVEDAIEVEVRDAGRGAASTAGEGHGLVGMRERAAMFGGSLEVRTEPGQGFHVRALLPCGTGA